MEGRPPVPLADAEVAAGIARAAAKGRGADRAPTLEQLLAAFGEREPTDAARHRVRSALEMADIRVRPDLLDAPPGERVLLQPAGTGGGGRSRALLGLLALAGVLAAAAVAATVAGQDTKSAHDSLPAEPASTAVDPARTAAAPQSGTSGTTPAPADTAAPATTDTTAAETTPTATAPAPTAAEQRAADRKREQRRRAGDLARRRRAAAAKRVTVRLVAPQPTFLCVEDEDGAQLFNGTLDGTRVFKGDDLRFNIGLATTEVRVNGQPVRLAGSPSGLMVTRKGGARDLPLGRRPCA